MKTVFVAPYVPSSVSAINLAALYFDEVVLRERTIVDLEPISETKEGESTGRVQALVSVVDNRLRKAIQPLLTEKLVSIDNAPPRHLLTAAQRGRIKEAYVKAEDMLFQHREGNQITIEINESGVQEIHEMLMGPLKVGGEFHIQAVSTYYEGLFTEAMDSALRGEPILSSSSVLYRMIERAATDPVLKESSLISALPEILQPRLALDVLNASLIDPSMLDSEDVLEARFVLRNELTAFRAELQRIQFEFTKEFGIDKVFREGRSIANARLTPRIRDIENKVKTGQIRVLRRMLESLEKPSAYVPLIGSAFAGVPLGIASAISLGLISARVALEAWEEHKQVANDGLFYLVKMRQLLKKHTSEQTPRHSLTAGERHFAKHLFLWPEDVRVLKENADSSSESVDPH